MKTDFVFLNYSEQSTLQKFELLRFIRKRLGNGYSVKEFVVNKPTAVFKNGKLYGFSETLRAEEK